MILQAQELIDSGLESGWVLGLKDFARYSEIDNYNHVNNKVYMTWFENLRVLYMDDLKLDISDPNSPRPVLRAAHVEYLEQMKINEAYITTTRCSRLGRTSFDLEYGVFSNGRLKAKGLTTQVMVTGEGTTTSPVPDWMREIFMTRDGAKT